MFGREERRIKDLEERLHELAYPKILEAHIKDGQFDMRLESPFAKLVFWFFWQILQGESGSAYAPNCVEMTVGNYADRKAGMIVITAQRQHGKTMAQLKTEAEAAQIKAENELGGCRVTLETAVQFIEACAGNFPNVRQNGNTDEFMDYLRELHDQAEVFVDAYRKGHPRAETNERGVD